MRYLKIFEDFKSIDEISTLIEISNELKDDYFEVEVYDTMKKDTGGYLFRALMDQVKAWERSYSPKNMYKSDQLEVISDIIIMSIRTPNNKEKFLWKDISDPITSCVNYMEFNGWRYILQPVWNNTSMNYRLDDMGIFNEQQMQSYHLNFYR